MVVGIGMKIVAVALVVEVGIMNWIVETAIGMDSVAAAVVEVEN